MKLIHCSDLHLDSKMESNLSKEKAKERNNEVFLTFKRLVSYAAMHDVRAVLIAGDLFDESRVSAGMLELVLGIIKSTPEIEFFYLKGNHDIGAMLKDHSGIKNLKTFDENWKYYKMGHVYIAGVELNEDNCQSIYESLNLKPENINIVMLHGQISTQVGSELVCLNELRNKNIDYLALGHIHSFQCERLDLRGRYCYSGCLEGRGFDECGEKGFVLLDINENQIESSFIPFSKRILHEKEVDISGLCTINEILDAIEKQLVSIYEKDMVKINLKGTFLPDTNKDTDFILKELEDRFYFVKIKDNSRLYINAEDYKYDKTLKGEFIRTVMASDKSEEEKERIICCGLAALRGEKISL